MGGACIFCKIASGEVKSEMVYQDDQIVAFKDANPIAPVHLLLVPRAHLAGLNEIGPANQEVIAHLLTTAARLAREFKVAESGYRCVINTNREAGQEVFHLHLHLLAGRRLHGLG